MSPYTNTDRPKSKPIGTKHFIIAAVIAETLVMAIHLKLNPITREILRSMSQYTKAYERGLYIDQIIPQQRGIYQQTDQWLFVLRQSWWRLLAAAGRSRVINCPQTPRLQGTRSPPVESFSAGPWSSLSVKTGRFVLGA